MAIKKDFTQIAYAVVQAATGEAPKPFTDKQVNSRKGGVKGGKERMAKLDEAERKALAAKGVAARKRASAGKAKAPAVKALVEQSELMRERAAMLAHVFEPAEAVSNVRTNMHAAGIHAVMHGSNPLVCKKPQGKPCPSTASAIH